MDWWFKAIVLLLCCNICSSLPSSGHGRCSRENKEKTVRESNLDSVKLLAHKVETKIRLRFSETSVTTILQNTHVSEGALYPWKIVIPQLAFLSSFHFFYVSIDNNAIEGKIYIKNETKSRPAVPMWVRNTNIFSADLEIEPLSEVQVFISYGEILERNLGYYQQNVYVLPEIVSTGKSVIITIDIDETADIKFVRVPFNIQDAVILRERSNNTKVIWSPSVDRDRNPKCAVSQYTVQFDVYRDRESGDGQVVWEDDEDDENDNDGSKAGNGQRKGGKGNRNGQNGAENYRPGRNRTRSINGSKGFSNNISGSKEGDFRDGTGGSSTSSKSGNGTAGKRFPNGTLLETVAKPANTVNSGDIVIISNYFFHFLVPVELKALRKHLVFIQDVSGSMDGRKMEQMKDAMMKTLSDLKSDDLFNIITFSGKIEHWITSNATIAATPQNVLKAKDFVKTLEAGGRTAINAALQEGFNLIKNVDPDLPDNVKSLLVFMTDGLPTDSNSTDILLNTEILNKNLSTPIHALGFGSDVDMSFLKSLSLKNYGLSRHIFDGFDAAEQLKSFYDEISSPVLTDVKIIYNSPDFDLKGLTVTNFTTVFGGKEIKVTGKIVPKVPGRGPFKLNVIIKGNSRRGPVVSNKVVSLLLAANIVNPLDNNGNLSVTTNLEKTRGANGGKDKSGGNQSGNSGSRTSSPFSGFSRRFPKGRNSKGKSDDYVNKVWTQITIRQLIDSYLTSGDPKALEELQKVALKEGIVTPYTSMKARLSPCSGEILLDPIPVEAVKGTNCSTGNIAHPLESISWFNQKVTTLDIAGKIHNVSLSNQQIEDDSEAGEICRIKTKAIVGEGSCQHLINCPQHDFKDSLAVYKAHYFCSIQAKRVQATPFAGVCCLTMNQF